MKKRYKYFIKSLKKPYPFREELDFQISLSFILGFFVFIILYLLKPFGLGVLENNLLYYFGGYGIITTVVILIHFLFIVPAFPNYFSDKTWNVKKEILTVSSVVLIVGSLAWIYHKKVALGNIEHNKFTYLYFLKYTASIGIFPVIIYVYLVEFFLTSSRKNISEVVKKKVGFNLSDIDRKKEKVIIYSSNKKNSLQFSLNNLIYITSEGNYACFFIIETKTNKVVEKILRVQLHIVEKELGKFQEIIRCHKSYIVNKNFVVDISGNARAHYLHLLNLETEIPVSRKFKKSELVALISS